MSFKNIDEQLLLKVKNGDLKAFDAMMLACEREIYGHLLRLSKNPDDAADLTQAVFVKVYKNRHLIETSSNFRAWLYKIASNTALDLFKKASYTKEKLIIDDPEYEVETNLEDDSYYIIEGINKIDVETALSRLDQSRRQIILLYYFEEFSYQEISEILSIPINTVKTNLRRAKEALRRELVA